MDKGANEQALIELLNLDIKDYNKINVKTIPTPYDNDLESLILNKKEWLQDTHVFWPDPLFVPGKRFKYKFATPDSIIIDDTLSVIEDWRNAGGIAIWHKDALSTISQLKMYL